MMTLELDDETATLLNQLVEQEHISPAQLVKNVTATLRVRHEVQKMINSQIITA